MPKTRYARAATEAAKKSYSPEEWNELRREAREIKQAHNLRDSQALDMEQIWWMDWVKDAPRSNSKDIKLTLSPDPANRIIGAQRLLTTTGPHFEVPFGKDEAAMQQTTSETLEELADEIWNVSGQARGRPLEKDLTLAALLYSEIQMSVTDTRDLVKQAGGSAVMQARAQRLARETPILIETWLPTEGYMARDRYGLSAFLRVYKTTWRRLVEDWPDAAVLRKGSDKLWHEVEVWDFYNLEWRCVWVGSRATTPIYAERHGLIDIPIVCQIVEGSEMFVEPEKQRRPWLYNLVKSGLWNRQNLSLTSMATIAAWQLSSAMFTHRAPADQKGKRVVINRDDTGLGVVELENDEAFDVLGRQGLIDPALMAFMQEVDKKAEASTIHGQALGEPLGGNAPYSMVALLHQAGRLPLSTTQVLSGWAIGAAMQLAFRTLRRREDEEITAESQTGVVKVSPSDIPELIRVNATLDVALAQDNLTNAQVAGNLVGQRISSRRWAREKLMNMGQSAKMDAEILSEEAGLLFALQMMQRAAAAGQRPPPGANGETPPEGGEVPPEGEGAGTVPAEPPQGEQPGLQGTGQATPLTRPLPARGMPR